MSQKHLTKQDQSEEKQSSRNQLVNYLRSTRKKPQIAIYLNVRAVAWQRRSVICPFTARRAAPAGFNNCRWRAVLSRHPTRSELKVFIA